MGPTAKAVDNTVIILCLLRRPGAGEKKWGIKESITYNIHYNLCHLWQCCSVQNHKHFFFSLSAIFSTWFWGCIYENDAHSFNFACEKIQNSKGIKEFTVNKKSPSHLYPSANQFVLFWYPSRRPKIQKLWHIYKPPRKF